MGFSQLKLQLTKERTADKVYFITHKLICYFFSITSISRRFISTAGVLLICHIKYVVVTIRCIITSHSLALDTILPAVITKGGKYFLLPLKPYSMD